MAVHTNRTGHAWVKKHLFQGALDSHSMETHANRNAPDRILSRGFARMIESRDANPGGSNFYRERYGPLEGK
jgi:hypothetical protein